VSEPYKSVADVIVLLQRDDGRVLALRHADFSSTAPGQLTVIGGRLAGEEFLDEGALRELYAGVGVRVARQDLEFCQLVHYRGSRGERVIGAVFTAQRWEGEPYNVETDRHAHIAWIDPGHPPSGCHPYTAAVLESFVTGRLYGNITASSTRTPPTPGARVTSRPRGTHPPLAQTALGVGVIVTDARGRVLLSRHRAGTWECPGGKRDPGRANEPGESLEAAAVRELSEETGLIARPGDVIVFAHLLDSVCGVNRMTAGALITKYSGTPVAVEPHIDRWEFRRLDDLPSPLFVPSAQILTAWNPRLPIDHPPAHVYRSLSG